MDPVDNNQFEVVPTSKTKRKIATPCPNVYLNPALDLLANEDPMCNTAMEIVPNKKRKCTKTCDIAAFENSALDLGISKAAVNEFLARELENVRKNIRTYDNCGHVEPELMLAGVTDIKSENPKIDGDHPNIDFHEPKIDVKIPNNEFDDPKIETTETIYTKLCNSTDLSQSEVLITDPTASLSDLTNTHINIPFIDNSLSIPDTCNTLSIHNGLEVSQIDVNDKDIDSEQRSNTVAMNSDFGNIDLSAINNTAIQNNITNQVFINNPSNLSLSFIDRLALESPSISSQSLCLDDDLNESNIMEIKTITIITKKKLVNKRKNTNPFLDPNLNEKLDNSVENPFLNTNVVKPEFEYNDDMASRPAQALPPQAILPRRLFTCETNSTVSTVNESLNTDQNEYENIDGYRPDSPIYENVNEMVNDNFNKQSKVLGHDVSHFSAVDIMNLNKNSHNNNSNESNDSKKDLKHQILRASNKLSKKVFKTLRKTFKGDKTENNTTLNPYEVPRKTPKIKAACKDAGIENPCLYLDNSDDIEIEEMDEDEHQYETIKTIRNTRLNMNVTPLKERAIDNADVSQNKTSTPGKKVRFDSTLNQEKVITGNSFDCGIQSPGFDAKIDKYHDELENCINERKFLQQNM